MTQGQPKQLRFNSPEEVVEFIRSKADDIESVTISVTSGVTLSSPSGRSKSFPGAAGCIQKTSGELLVLERDQLEILLNNRLLSRLRLSIELIPACTGQFDTP